MLFVGHTRFSLLSPSSEAWRASNGSRFSDLEEYAEYLFSEERLQPRAEVFFNEGLPQIEAAIRDHDVVHVVSFSDSLPGKYQDFLFEAANKYRFLVLDPRSSRGATNDPFEVARRAVAKVGQEHGLFGLYRVDDDDLLPVDYFDRMAPYVTRAHVGWNVSFGTGITGLRIGSDYYFARRCHYPMFSAGLMSVCRVALSGNIIKPLGVSHSDSDKANPVILDSREPGYFWGRHTFQDTALDLGLPADSSVLNRIRESMGRYPALTNEDVSALFPVLAGRLHPEAGPQEGQVELLPAPLDLGDRPCPFEVEPVSGRMRLNVSLVAVDCAEKNSALISFDLRTAVGESLEGEWDERLRQVGIFRSANRGIGYYRYLPTGPGEHEVDLVFDLPSGVLCRGASVRRFGRDGGSVRMTHLSISASEL